MENRKSVDQRRQSVDEFVQRHAASLGRQGAIVASYRTRGGERVGPYYRLTFRDADQRQIAIYLGCDEALIADVRERLTLLQNSLRARRQWAGIRRSLRRAARDARKQLRTELGKKGLLLKGHEIRGWRAQRRQDLDMLIDNARPKRHPEQTPPSPKSPSCDATSAFNPSPSLSAPHNPTPHED